MLYDDFEDDDGFDPFVKATIVSALMFAVWLVFLGLVALVRLVHS